MSSTLSQHGLPAGLQVQSTHRYLHLSPPSSTIRRFVDDSTRVGFLSGERRRLAEKRSRLVTILGTFISDRHISSPDPLSQAWPHPGHSLVEVLPSGLQTSENKHQQTQELLSSNGLTRAVSNSSVLPEETGTWDMGHACSTALAERDASYLQLCCPKSNQSASSHPAEVNQLSRVY